MFALPVPRRGNAAVVVTVGLESLLQARTHGLRLALGFAVPTILLVTVLVHLTVRQLVGRPLGAILRTMDETAAGDLRARTTMTRRDELGTIAVRLNEMLDQLERFNQSLHDRIEEATRDLLLRNAQLAASQSELFALRESLARAERVAALGQVAANVAHQAGTPLNLVSGYVQMIRDDPRTDDRTRTRLLTVDTQIQQVTRVLRTMLDHARQPSGFEIVEPGDHHRAGAGARPAAAVAREYPAAGLGRRGSAADQGRRHATRDGAAQPGHQRARRHARRRHAVDRGGGAPGRGPRRSRRHRVGDSGGGHGPSVRCRG